MEEYSNAKQIAKLKAGLKGGPFNPPPTPKKYTFTDGWPAESVQVQTMGMPVADGVGSMIDPWGQRHRSGK